MTKHPKKRSTTKSSKKPKTPENKITSSARTYIQEQMLKRLGFSSTEEFETTSKFRQLDDKERVKESRQIIQETVIEARQVPDATFALAVTESETLLKGYSTLDDEHRAEIQKLIKQISTYLKDPTRKRPFNALMLAAPGAGKSHFISQLAKTMKAERVEAVNFNMATMQSADDMAQPVDELRNVKVNDQFPLLFLDEFDSDPSRYAALLPLLWEGELQVGHRDLKLGKAVIVLAGSNPDLPKAMDRSAKMGLAVDTAEGTAPAGKLIDLLSRINGGVINIPDLDLRSENRDRRVDKICMAVALLRKRFGNDLVEIPRALLRFIAETTFRYQARSITHLIDSIDSDALQSNVLKLDSLGLPIATEKALQESSLRLHIIDKDMGFGVVNRWKRLSGDKATVRLKSDSLNLWFA